MNKITQFLKSFRFRTNRDLKSGYDALKKGERQFVIGAFIVAIVSFLSILYGINSKFLVSVPLDGGSMTEGIVGMPTLVNPVLAISEGDKDLTTLVYSGLVRKEKSGVFIPDLAESYNVSSDETIYTFVIKDSAVFHNGMKVTADDILFTIEKIKDPLIKSPRKVEWEGVTASKVDDRTVRFTLKQPYSSFIDNLTLGILPSNVWKNVSVAEFGLSGLNIKPIGSGPYMIKSVSKNSDGIPESYSLTRFKKFVLGVPHIKKITIKSYANEKDMVNALANGKIDQAGGIDPENAVSFFNNDNIVMEKSALPRMFGLFFNKTENALVGNANVIKAISLAIDRQEIIDSVLKGYGFPIDSAIPNGFLDASSLEAKVETTANKDEATALLLKDGWKMGDDGILAKTPTKSVKDKKGKVTTVASGPATKLTFTITTGDTPELKQTAEKIQSMLGSIGIQVELRVYETGPLNQIIRSREYEALFFGQVINHESDLFAFWHSSQKADPGLNIAMYANSKADVLLESAQKILNEGDRMKKYTQLKAILDADSPAIFIYSPEYIYAHSTKVHLGKPLYLTTAPERFASIYSWYADTDEIWKIFAR
jgi:peptide/nickel transport system substrate-binding protein